MKEKLLQIRATLEEQMRQVDDAIEFFDKNPDMDKVAGAYMAIVSSGMMFSR